MKVKTKHKRYIESSEGTIRIEFDEYHFSDNCFHIDMRFACKKLNIEDLHFHDLRHDGISRMFVPGGYSIPEVAAVSGHKSWKNLQRYTQIRPEELHR